MKKIGLLATSLIACMSLAGCGNKTSKLKIASDQSLTKVGQYHEANSEDPKMTLIAIKHINKTQKVDQVTFKFNDAKLIKMEARNKGQLAEDETNFGVNLPKTYYEYQLDYTIKNNSNSKINDNGAELILPNSKQVSSNEGAMDSLAGEKIQSHASKDGFIQAKAGKSDKDKLTKFKFVSPELFDNKSEVVNIDQHTISFN